jgi:hypothetical protein
MNILKRLYLLMSIGLFVFVTIGHYLNVNEDWLNNDINRRKALEYNIHSTKDVQRYLRQSYSEFDSFSDPKKMVVIYSIVEDLFVHREALHTPLSNIVLYAFGGVVPSLRHVWSPDILLDKFKYGFCDQSNYVLLYIASLEGIKVRSVGLKGHVVMEAWHNNQWNLYDVDHRVIPYKTDGSIHSVMSLGMHDDDLKKYYKEYGAMFKRIENHNFNVYPRLARHSWRANVGALIEQVAEILKFLIPFVFIFHASMLLFRKKR